MNNNIANYEDVVKANPSPIVEFWKCGGSDRGWDDTHCGRNYYENVTAVRHEDGSLTISGTGKMGHLCRPDILWGRDITRVTILEGVESIGIDAFAGCRKLTEVVMPNSLKTIKGGAFCNCISLTSITIPENVTSIWDEAFNGCRNLRTIICKNPIPPKRDDYRETPIECALYVPAESMELYKASYDWNEHSFTTVQAI